MGGIVPKTTLAIEAVSDLTNVDKKKLGELRQALVDIGQINLDRTDFWMCEMISLAQFHQASTRVDLEESDVELISRIMIALEPKGQDCAKCFAVLIGCALLLRHGSIRKRFQVACNLLDVENRHCISRKALRFVVESSTEVVSLFGDRTLSAEELDEVMVSSGETSFHYLTDEMSVFLQHPILLQYWTEQSNDIVSTTHSGKPRRLNRPQCT